LTKASEKQQAAVLNDRNYQIAGSLSEYVAARGRTMLELAIGWLLAHREVSSVITGASSTTQIAANAASASWVLTPTELSEVNELLPDITL
jgi:aryl-alcohol dehydrogenase-like predicted oxidoreductase